MLTCSLFVADSSVFTQDIRTVYVRDLNFVLRFKIFVHWDEQLQASHLILNVDPVYSTWQPFGQALLVDSPLLSYIDVRHTNFLPPKFTVGEAQDIGRQYTCSDELAPIRDELVEIASRCLQERAHKAIQRKDPTKPEAPVQEAKHAAIESSNSSRMHSICGEEMVTYKTLTISRFIPGARQVTQQQPPQGRGQTPLAHPPPPPPSTQTRKR